MRGFLISFNRVSLHGSYQSVQQASESARPAPSYWLPCGSCIPLREIFFAKSESGLEIGLQSKRTLKLFSKINPTKDVGLMVY